MKLFSVETEVNYLWAEGDIINRLDLSDLIFVPVLLNINDPGNICTVKKRLAKETGKEDVVWLSKLDENQVRLIPTLWRTGATPYLVTSNDFRRVVPLARAIGVDIIDKMAITELTFLEMVKRRVA